MSEDFFGFETEVTKVIEAGLKLISDEFAKQTKALEAIAFNTMPKPEVDAEDYQRGLAASLLGNTSGFADWLTEALDATDNFERAKKLRELEKRAHQMKATFQTQLDELNSKKKTDE